MEQTLAFYINLLRGDFTQFCAQRLKELGLSQGLLYFLLYVGRHPGCSAGELASVIGADSGHTTRSVEKLVQQREGPRAGPGNRLFLRRFFYFFDHWFTIPPLRP